MTFPLSTLWRAVFGVDLRTLALFRVLLAGAVALDLGRRLADTAAFYGDAGVLPRDAWARGVEPWRWSLHAAGGETWLAGLLIGLQLLVALALLLGWRARLSALLTFLLLVSLQNRNPLILSPADNLMAALLFWSPFLPISARWSVDAALAANPPPADHRHLSWASAGLLLQALAAIAGGLALRPEQGALLALAALPVLLRGWAWDAAARHLAHGRVTRIYYDRDCGFCRKSVLLLRTLLALPQAEIRPAQDSARADALMQAHYSWVVVDAEDRAHLKWAAFVALLRDSLLFGGLYRLVRLPLWNRPGDALYDFVARHRGRFAAVTAALLPEDARRFEAGPALQGVAAAHLALALAWSLGAIGPLPDAVGAALAPYLRALRIEPQWNAPAPPAGRDAGWLLAPGRLADGSEVDVLRPQRPLSYDYDRPPAAPAQEAPPRWREYRARLRQAEYAGHRPLYARYLCRQWNSAAAGDRRLQTLKLVHLLERTPPDGRAPALEQRVLLRQDCDD
ncbi:MAG: DUF393 domain-containing protein [Gammaproteobacteria bacterium]|nr:DUF393 domain-containing protein [Gammaproteobacteria bacterium]